MKNVIMYLALFIIGNTAVSQNIKTTVYKLNLGNPTQNSIQNLDSTKRLVLPTKNLLAFKLENGNPYKYRYVINSRIVNFFENVKYNNLDSLGKIKVSDKFEHTSNKVNVDSIISVDSIKLLENRKNSLLKAIQANNKSQNNSLKIYSIKINKLIEDEISEIDIKIETLRSQISLYKSQAVYAYEIVKENKIIANNLGIKEIVANSLEDDKTNISNAFKLLKIKASNLKSDINRYTAEISTEDFLDKEDFIKTRKEFESSYIKLLSDITNLNSDAINIDENKVEYAKKLGVFNIVSLDIKQEIVKMFQLKLNNYLLPIDINGKNIDLVEITVERFDKTTVNPIPDKYTYNIYIKGGLKIDISGGLFITSLIDKEYDTKDVLVNVNGTNETQKIIYEKNKGSYDFGFGSMVNTSLRGGSWIRPALSIGALFTANQKFQILSGLGLILGKEERIILHFGLSMGSVAEISNQFKADGSTSYNLGTSGQVSTSDKFKFGHFFGLTYNLGKTKTQEKHN